MPDLAHRLAVARGDELADVVVEGGKVFSAFTREWLDTEIAIVDGYVAGLGQYAGKEVVHARGKYVVPGFVDAHMHLESSKLLVDEFARLVLPFGTTAVVADPHEIANVLGTDGVHWLLDACDEVPLDVFVMASSCVPASHVKSMVRASVARGIAPEDAIVMASHNPATWHGLKDLGAIAPGFQADVLVLADLERFEPELVLKRGRPVGEISRL